MPEFDGTRTQSSYILTGRDQERPLTFDDIRALDTPEWAQSGNIQVRIDAQRDAEEIYRRAFNPGPTSLFDVLSQTHDVLDEIEVSVNQIWALLHRALTARRWPASCPN